MISRFFWIEIYVKLVKYFIDNKLSFTVEKDILEF